MVGTITIFAPLEIETPWDKAHTNWCFIPDFVHPEYDSKVGHAKTLQALQENIPFSANPWFILQGLFPAPRKDSKSNVHAPNQEEVLAPRVAMTMTLGCLNLRGPGQLITPFPPSPHVAVLVIAFGWPNWVELKRRGTLK